MVAGEGRRTGIAFGNGGAALLLIKQLSRFLEGRLTVSREVPVFLSHSSDVCRTLASILGKRLKVCQKEC